MSMGGGSRVRLQSQQGYRALQVAVRQRPRDRDRLIGLLVLSLIAFFALALILFLWS